MAPMCGYGRWTASRWFCWEDRVQASLKVTSQVLLLDLGEVRRLQTQDGPKLARYIAVLREKTATCTRLGRGAVGPQLMRAGVPPSQTLVYMVPHDPLEYEQIDSTLSFPGLRLYLETPPDFVETPHYAYLERSPHG